MSTGYRRLAANRDFQRLWIGQTVSEVGTGISRFVLPLVAYDISGSALQTAVVGAAQGLATVLFLLPAGALVDRWDRRRVLVRANLAGAVAYTSLVAAAATGNLTVWHLVAGAFVTGTAEAFNSPAESSAIRQIVSSEDLPTALSQNQARMQVAGLLSGPLGGVLLAAARVWPFVVDAASFVIATVSLGQLRTHLGPSDAGDEPTSTGLRRLTSDIGEGLGFVRRHPFGRVFIPWAAVANCIGNAFFFVVLLRMLDAGWSSAVIGAAELPVGLAGVLGAMAAPWIIRRLRGGTLAMYTVWCWIPLCLPLVWIVNPWVLAACLAPVIFMNPVGNAGLASFRMHTTPQHMQARTSSAGQFLAMSFMWLAQPLGAALYAWFGGQAALLVVLGLMALNGLPPTISRAVRAVGKPAQWPSAEDYLARA